jgi:hypothetical protein
MSQAPPITSRMLPVLSRWHEPTGQRSSREPNECNGFKKGRISQDQRCPEPQANRTVWMGSTSDPRATRPENSPYEIDTLHFVAVTVRFS